MFLQGEATIHYNKLQADPKQGKSLDIGISSTRHILTISLDSLFVYITLRCVLCIEFFHYHSNFKHVLCVSVLKKVKHRLVENMSSGTADALGLSRAILCNGEIIVMSVMILGVDFYKWI